MYYKIFTQELCAKLMLRGFKLRGLVPDEKNKGFNIFLFDDTEQIRTAVKQIKK